MKPKVTIIIPVFNQEDLILRALDSIPKRNDIEVIVINDGSTDNTAINVDAWRNKNKYFNTKLINLEENKGCGFAKNVGLDNATGEYVIQLDSDDYLYTEEYSKVIDSLDGTDIIYINLRINNGTIWEVNKNNCHEICSTWSRFIKRSFLGDTRGKPTVYASDWYLNEEIQKIPHTEKFTGIVAYHYNFPREGSIVDLAAKGLFKK